VIAARLGMFARRGAVPLGYLAIVLAVLRLPLGTLGRSIPTGTEPCDTVPFALAWAIGWGMSRIDALARLDLVGAAAYWDAPIFHPTPGAFALSEPMPALALAGWPLHAIGVPLAGVITSLVVATLVANGVMMRRWLLHLRSGARLASVGGAIACMLPFVHQELGVLPLVAIGPLVWMLTAIGDLLGGARPQRRAGLELGLATAVAFACCGQLTLFTALLLVPAGACLVRFDRLRGSFAVALGLAASIAAAGVLPLALPQRATLETLGLRRSDRSQGRGAVRPRQLLRVPWEGVLPLPAVMVAKRAEDRALDPGPLRVLAAVGGVVLGLARRRRRREVAMLLVLVLGSIALAFGPRIDLGGWQPSETLADVVPGYGHIRALFRAGVLAQLGTIALAMLGLRALQVRMRAHRRRPWPISVLALVLAVELVPPSPRWTELPEAERAWVQWLRDEAEPGAAIAWIPFAPTGEVCDHEATAAAMLLGLDHGHPLLNGYSSFFPPLHNRTSHAARMLPHGRGIVALRMAGARYLVAPDGGPLDGIDDARRALLGIDVAMRDEAAGVTIWSVRSQ
jgi:hypothetical protein